MQCLFYKPFNKPLKPSSTIKCVLRSDLLRIIWHQWNDLISATLPNPWKRCIMLFGIFCLIMAILSVNTCSRIFRKPSMSLIKMLLMNLIQFGVWKDLLSLIEFSDYLEGSALDGHLFLNSLWSFCGCSRGSCIGLFLQLKFVSICNPLPNKGKKKEGSY